MNSNKEVIFSLNNLKGEKVKIAGFDMDHTLIKPRKGHRFPKTPNDMELNTPNVISMLKKFHYNGYTIIIFSNQSPRNKDKFNKLIERLNHVVKLLHEIPINIVVSYKYNYYRKPMTGMFELVQAAIKDNKYKFDKKNSFYCGDAAGRPNDWLGFGRKADFSDSDLFFAHNAGITFKYPEEIFKNIQLESSDKYYFPKRPFLNCIPQPINIKLDDRITNPMYVIFLIGPPASGKSQLTKLIKKTTKKTFKVIEYDEYRNKPGDIIKDTAAMGKHMILDGQNRDVSVRKQYMNSICLNNEKNKNIYFVAINMTTDPAILRQLNYFRSQSEKTTLIATVVYRTFNKYYRPPRKEEGFKEIINYSVCPEFKGKKKKLYEYYY
jgi:bifunctional polynucleotide phosphatase/kinase